MDYDARMKFIPITIASYCCLAGVAFADTEFERVVSPFIASHCVDCHGKDDPAGNISLLLPGTDFSNEIDVSTWQRILEQLVLGQMPPQDQPAPVASQVLYAVEKPHDEFGRMDLNLDKSMQHGPLVELG